MSNPNTDMDDYELFGGEPPSTPQRQPTRTYPTAQPQEEEAAPVVDRSRGTRSTLADTAAAVARRKREADRSAIIHEILLIGGFLAVVVVAWLFYRQYMDRKAEQERLAHEYTMKEQAAQAERAKKQREEDMARREKIQKEKEAKQAALQKEREEKRAAEMAKRQAQAEAAKAVQRIKLLLSAFRGAEIDYYKNAVDAERPDKVNAEALFICLMPGGGSGCDLYEIRTKAGESMEVVRLTESGKPEPIGKEAFAEKLKASPSLILRDRGTEMISRPDLKVYFLDPTRSKRGFRNTASAPSADSMFSPSKEDFGALYDAVCALGCSKLAFKYKVVFRGGGLADPVFVKEVGLGEELGRNAFRDAVRKSLESSRRGRRLTDADIEQVLRAGTVVFTPTR